MPPSKISDADFALRFEAVGPARLARDIGVNERNIHARRRRLEGLLGRPLTAPSRKLQAHGETGGRARVNLDVQDGTVIIGSDAHYWPGIISTAHAGLVHFCEQLRPIAVVMNGDLLDFPKGGRWPSIGWEYRPEIADEIESAQERLAEITAAAPNARHVWPLGNHDARFESLVANQLPQLANVKGVHLKDHFPDWEPCWSAWINNSVVVKHRHKSGLHAALNNALWSGRSIATGHLHKGIVYPLTDYNGTRYGVDLPWMGENHGPQVEDYTEDNPVNWRSGFCVLTFKDGRLMQPELAFAVATGVIEFRGEWHNV
jgi:hypothetical protein